MALHGYISTWMASEGVLDVPRIVIAHDVRHFSRHFCELAASTWSAFGWLRYGVRRTAAQRLNSVLPSA